MAADYTCPVCGNRGKETTDGSGAFEVRGHFEGKPVSKCRQCGSGLMAGLFSCGLFGIDLYVNGVGVNPQGGGAEHGGGHDSFPEVNDDWKEQARSVPTALQRETAKRDENRVTSTLHYCGF